MSIFTDAFRLIDDDSNAFTFLPIVNHGYVYWQTANPSTTNVAIMALSLLISTILYNILSNSDFSEYNSPSKNAIPLASALFLLSVVIIWTGVLGYSLVLLYENFSASNFLPGLLLGVSLTFICIKCTDLILSKYLPIYREN